MEQKSSLHTLQALLENDLSIDGSREELVIRLDESRPDIWKSLLDLG